MPFEVQCTFGLLGVALDLCWPLELPRAWAWSRTGPGTPELNTVLPDSWDPGDAQSGRRFDASGPYYQFNNCLIQGTFNSELHDLRLRTVIVQLFDWTAASQPGGTV